MGALLFVLGPTLMLLAAPSLDEKQGEVFAGLASISAFGLVVELIALRWLGALTAWRNGRIIPARIEWIKQGIALPKSALIAISLFGGAPGSLVVLCLLTLGKSSIVVTTIEGGTINHRKLRLDTNITAAVPGQPMWIVVTESGRATPLWNVPGSDAQILRVPAYVKSWMGEAYALAASQAAAPPTPGPDLRPRSRQSGRLDRYR